MPTDAFPPAALWKRIEQAPLPETHGDGNQFRAIIEQVASDPELGDLSAILRDERAAMLIRGVLDGSPYLRGLINRDLRRLQRVLVATPEVHILLLEAELARSFETEPGLPDAIRAVRVFKSEVALTVALADLGGVWSVMNVTEALTRSADAALTQSVRLLFRKACEKGDWLDEDEQEAAGRSGYIVLGMGKYGAGELNYSSDIDLIVFYDLERVCLREGIEPQPFFVKLTRDLVRLMDERTSDGYVFRTDLRLRPDAGATQIALSRDAALGYYESFGQNWERAALIKARPVAGDIEAGQALLSELAPFIWRKYLDFAAIADIHAMKRQIHTFRGLGGIGVAGHNVKLGRGGIREIEFFAQTQQLIAGGRQKDLRVRRTLDALERLVARGWIKEDVRRDLEAAYLYLRSIEHRIQMVADEQTHELPDAEGELARFARFAGYENLEVFSRAFVAVLEAVQRHYSGLFEDMPELTAAGSNMVFAGEVDDPGTVGVLEKLGFQQPSSVLASVRGWHHGRYPAVRSARARELLTEVQPRLITALGETADPSGAFANFDRFLSELPSGVQLFSLLKANPTLLQLVADIMGTAPRLARILSRRRRLLDAVLDPRLFTALPTASEFDSIIATDLTSVADAQEVLDQARIVGSEQGFLIGVRVLTGAVNASQAGGAYALLAERLIVALKDSVESDLVRAHGAIEGGSAVVVGMGKLGGREMTAASDLDLILVYDFDPACQQSTGEKPLSPGQYYARLTQRLIGALSAPTSEGMLYEVDMRLRPSGNKGPVATQLASFLDYQISEAWTWEQMALTRARTVGGPTALRKKVDTAIRETLVRQRDRAKVTADVRDMRQRIESDKGTGNIWDLKQVRGGLIDLEFIAQYLQLIHAHQHPDVLDQNTVLALRKLKAHGCLDEQSLEHLIGAARLINDLTQILRLCIEGQFDPAKAPKGLKDLLARAGEAPTFEALETRLHEVLARTAFLFNRIIA